MVLTNSAKTRLVVVFLVLFYPVFIAGRTAQAQAGDADLDIRLAKDRAVFLLLFEERGLRGGESETARWIRSGTLNDPDRIERLTRLLREHPNSDFADDAAFLLARAKLYYENDPDAAIEALYKVVKDYPDGAYVAGDPIFLQAVVRRGTRSVGDVVRIDALRSGGPSGEKTPEFRYLEYLWQHPNLTADQARITIAWILSRQRRDRLAEAERLLREVVDSHRDQGRTQADLEAGAAAGFRELVRSGLVRSERLAHHHLIDLLVSQGKLDEGRREVEAYKRLHAGHPSADGIDSALGQERRQ
jgi:hypothetical protein